MEDALIKIYMMSRRIKLTRYHYGHKTSAGKRWGTEITTYQFYQSFEQYFDPSYICNEAGQQNLPNLNDRCSDLK